MKIIKPFLGALTIVCGLISGLMFFQGGASLNTEGKELTLLRSVGGNSVAEEYYQTMGRYGMAYSHLCYAMGLGIIALSLGLGGILITSPPTSQNSHGSRLLACPSCSNPCSLDAVSCPVCGAHLRKAAG